MARTALQKKDNRTDVTVPEPVSNVYFTPRVDILEKEDELVVYADLPGVKPDTLDVRFDNGELTLEGRCEPRQKDVRYFQSEYGVGNFYRAFTLNQDIDAEHISAQLKQGVLTLRLPKAEAARPRKITVKGE